MNCPHPALFASGAGQGCGGAGGCQLLPYLPVISPSGGSALGFGTAGAAPAPVVVFAPMVTGGVLVFRSCLGSAVEHEEPLEAIITISILCLVPMPFVYKFFVARQLFLFFQPW